MNNNESGLQPALVKMRETASKQLMSLIPKQASYDSPTLKRLIVEYASSVDPVERHDILVELVDYLWAPMIDDGYIEHFNAFDKLYVALGKREHFVHQFEVFLIGTQLLNIIKRKTSKLEAIFGLSDEKDIDEALMMAAFSHDLGYSLGGGSYLLSKISELYSFFGVETLSEVVKLATPFIAIDKNKGFANPPIRLTQSPDHVETSLDAMQYIKQRLKENLAIDGDSLEEVFTNLSEGDKPDHGLVSAVILLQIGIRAYFNGMNGETKDWEKFTNSKEYKKLGLAVSAVLLHNIKKPSIIKKISPKRSIFSYLLLLADNIQEWDRTVYPDAKYPYCYLSGFESSESDEKREICVKYHLYHTKWPQDMIKATKKMISDKRKLFKQMRPDKPYYDVTVSIQYIFNESEHFTAAYTKPISLVF